VFGAAWQVRRTVDFDASAVHVWAEDRLGRLARRIGLRSAPWPLAGDRDVAFAGGAATVNQHLAASLVDELRTHIAPAAGLGRPPGIDQGHRDGGGHPGPEPGGGLGGYQLDRPGPAASLLDPAGDV
jgi:hypothetical protein